MPVVMSGGHQAGADMTWSGTAEKSFTLPSRMFLPVKVCDPLRGSVPVVSAYCTFVPPLLWRGTLTRLPGYLMRTLFSRCGRWSGGGDQGRIRVPYLTWPHSNRHSPITSILPPFHTISVQHTIIFPSL